MQPVVLLVSSKICGTATGFTMPAQVQIEGSDIRPLAELARPAHRRAQKLTAGRKDDAVGVRGRQLLQGERRHMAARIPKQALCTCSLGQLGMPALKSVHSANSADSVAAWLLRPCETYSTIC